MFVVLITNYLNQKTVIFRHGTEKNLKTIRGPVVVRLLINKVWSDFCLKKNKTLLIPITLYYLYLRNTDHSLIIFDRYYNAQISYLPNYTIVYYLIAIIPNRTVFVYQR